jgi:hypothetical protein
MKTALSILLGFVVLLGMPASKANVLITDPTGAYSVGIGPEGELFDDSSSSCCIFGVGFMRNADGYDPLFPGTPRDSWGVSTITGAAFADYTLSGGVLDVAGNVALVSAPTGVLAPGVGATYVTNTGNGLTVAQQYGFAAPNILRIIETVTNNGAATVVLFQRDIDWDVAPTEFDEVSMGNGTAMTGVFGPIIDSSYFGLEYPDPTFPFAFSCALGCSNQGDYGGGIKLNLGLLATGSSVTFNFYYGISQLGQDVAALDAQARALGVTYDILTTSSGASFGQQSAFIGYGSPVPQTTPEPASVALFGTALASVGVIARWRRKNSAFAR